MTDATPLDNAAARARLREIVAQKSLSVGPQVTLASGAASRFYFNMKPTVFDAEGAALIGDLILDAIAEDDPYYDHVGGMEVGAIPIVAALTLRSWQRQRPIAGFFVRKQPKDHGTRRLVEGDLAAGANVLIVEDVTTTGGSTLNAVRGGARDRRAGVQGRDPGRPPGRRRRGAGARRDRTGGDRHGRGIRHRRRRVRR